MSALDYLSEDVSELTHTARYLCGSLTEDARAEAERVFAERVAEAKVAAARAEAKRADIEPIPAHAGDVPSGRIYESSSVSGPRASAVRFGHLGRSLRHLYACHGPGGWEARRAFGSPPGPEPVATRSSDQLLTPTHVWTSRCHAVRQRV